MAKREWHDLSQSPGDETVRLRAVPGESSHVSQCKNAGFVTGQSGQGEVGNNVRNAVKIDHVSRPLTFSASSSP